MTTKRKPSTKTTLAIPSRLYRANSKPTAVVTTLTPKNIDKHVLKTLSAKTQVFDTDVAAGKALLDLAKSKRELSKMLYATIEAIEHYSEGFRKNDPVVRAHAEIAKQARIVWGKFGAPIKKAK